MTRNYRTERDAILQRFYGDYAQPQNPRPHRSWSEGPITRADCMGIPMPVNSPFFVPGYCMAWKYALNQEGYGTLLIDGKPGLAHRAVFIQAVGELPEETQVNHLCDRPYCIQPSHLYAGTKQDNKDDSRIFNSHELITAPWILLWPDDVETEDPLRQRLRNSNRYHGAQPWGPVEQPSQKSLLPRDEFTCPGHDFAITMQGGDSKICRICEVSEFDDRMVDERGIWVLIAELCPASQTVTPIFEKVTRSEFVGETFSKLRRGAYRRQDGAPWATSHDLRNCACHYCTQDRAAFREAIGPLLTGEEAELLDACDRLEPLTAGLLQEAAEDMMETLARHAGMNDDEAQALREHHRDCINTSRELTRTCRTIEKDFAYLLHALGTFQDREEMLLDEAFQWVMMGWDLARLKPEDREQVVDMVSPAAEGTADKMALAFEREAEGLTGQFSGSKSGFSEALRLLARELAWKQVLEHLRYEFLGRNSATETWPHPHRDCIASIRRTGRVEPFLREFDEGKGYRHSGT